jgi:uncharacterized repeat protein (TIGR01451 family)
MRKSPLFSIILSFILAAALLNPVDAVQGEISPPVAAAAIQPPVLLWQHGGCYSSWCETGWYSSPAVADLNGDGKMEVIGSAYTIFVLDGATGNLLWKMASGHDITQPTASSVGRTWPGIVVADVDNDGLPEIVTAHSGGYVSVYDHTGKFKPGWPKQPVSDELRSLAVADLDGDKNMEVVVGRAQLNAQNVWVYDHNGNIRPGWPQITGGSGSAAGIYNDNLAIGDLVPGGNLEIVAPSDVITIAAYNANGGELPTNPMYYNHPGHDMRVWGAVPAYVDLAYELQGYGPCYTQFTPRANFADGPADIVDVNNYGTREVVVVGNVHDCHTNPYTDLYFTPYILNADRSRFQAGSYDWTTPPVNTGAPLSEDYNRIETAEPNPVTVDLDGDGKKEILYASYDGKVHAFWLDKTEHGSWPFSVYHSSDGYLTFASEPVVADLNNDGKPEVIFSSWTEKGHNATGKLYILDNMGNQLQAVALPNAFGGGSWNGALAAPTLADINNDGNLEVVLNTAASGLVAYTLPGTSQARILWGTGRGSFQRTGDPNASPLDSGVAAYPAAPVSGSRYTYAITLRNPGLFLSNVKVTDSLPAGVSYFGNPIYSSGTFSETAGTVTWRGSVQTFVPVTISFQVTLGSLPPAPQVITNTVQVDSGAGYLLTRQAVVIANGLSFFMPLVSK